MNDMNHAHMGILLALYISFLANMSGRVVVNL